MSNPRFAGLFSLLVALLFIPGCGEREAPAAVGGGGKPVAAVALPPYAGLVERIAGDHFEVVSLVGEHDDPHTYTPNPREVVALAGAAVYFAIDLPFEHLVLEALRDSDTRIRIVDLAEGLERRHYSCGEHDHDHDHDHGEHDHAEGGHDHGEHEHDDHEHDHEEGDGEHGHGHGDPHEEEIDPHIWLSPALLVEQVRRMAGSLADLVEDEEAKEAIAGNGRELVAEITETDRELAELLAPIRGRTFFVYHGAFGYLADAYGLHQETVELSGRSPEPRQLAALIEKAKEEGVTVVFVQPQFDQSSARVLAEAIGGTVLSIDPLRRDVLANLREIAQLLRDS